MKDINELILKGTTDRLRPVLLTAAAAALGFLPMAISSSAGAEVQRPLATVVIGGLFTATILTMIVLPVLFKLLDRKAGKKAKFKIHANATMILLLLSSSLVFSQKNNPELDSLISKAQQNNKAIKAAQLQIDKTKANIKTAYSFDKTNIYYSYDQNNIAMNNLPLKVFGVQQRFAFPTVYDAQKKLNSSEYDREKSNFEITKNRLSNEVAQTYNHIVYLNNQEKLYKYLDSLYQNFSKASDRRFELGETNYLEKITAQSKFRQIRTKLNQIDKDKAANQEHLQALIQSDEKIVIKNDKLIPNLTLENNSNKGLYISYFEGITKTHQSNIKLQKQHYLPDINLEYFQGKNNGLSQSLYGFQVGLAVPILFGGTKAKINVAKLELQSWEQQKQNEITKIDQLIAQKKNELIKHEEGIKYYTEYGEKLAKEIIKVGDMSYKHGEIDFFQYITSLENATTIQVDYLENVLQYNKTQIDLQYLNY